jgi:phosphoribosyl-AMP cyclohydrolase
MAERLTPDFAKGGGLVTAIAQDVHDGTILMVAYMNEEAWRHTLASGTATYWSRSRNELWIKGQSSGNVQRVHEVRLDCDRDAVLLKVEQIGEAACHTGHRSCFYRVRRDEGFVVDGEPVFDPREVYGQ